MINNYIEVFSNLNTFINTIDNRDRNEVFVNANEEASRTESASQAGTDSYEEATELLTNGDRASLSKLRKANINGITSNETIQKLKITKSVCGCLPNVPAFLMGVPNNMLNFKQVHQKSKIINIAVNTCVPWTVTTEEIIKAGKKITAVIKELELQNFRVNLYTGILAKKAHRKNTQYVGMLVNVKKSSSPLNLLNIAYPIINPSMLRRHFFKFLETVPVKIHNEFSNGYGETASFKDVLKNNTDIRNKFKDYICIDLYDILGKSAKDVAKEFLSK